MSPRTKKQFEEMRQDKKTIILSAALRLFANTGYHATSISTIAREAGISKGLMYNYFDSKESLLADLLNGYLTVLGSIINPDNDDEITPEELSAFFDLLRKSLVEDNEYWRLYSQLSLQPEVLTIFFEKLKSGAVILKHQQLIYKYFAERFENYETEAFIFTSLLKGFTIQYAFAPEMFSEKVVDGFIQRMKNLYIKAKKPDSI